MSREDAYKLVQQHALAAFDGGAPLQERVIADPAVSKVMTREEIGEVEKPRLIVLLLQQRLHLERGVI
jgi:adenylosuccinate lyase